MIEKEGFDYFHEVCQAAMAKVLSQSPGARDFGVIDSAPGGCI
jgi:hypothetical protein